MRRLTYETFLGVIVGAVFITAFGVVGRMDFNDELRAAVHYCEMVEAGRWPDYENRAGDCVKTYTTAAQYLPASN